MGGAVLGTASYVEEVRQKMIVWGQAPDPFACWLLERGLKTLDVRIRRQNENAMRIAEWCAERKEVRAVHYPGLPTHPDHEVARKSDGRLRRACWRSSSPGGGRAADRFLRKLQVYPARAEPGRRRLARLASRASRRTRTSRPRSGRRAAFPDGFLRLSVGIEDADDLIADIEQALH